MKSRLLLVLFTSLVISCEKSIEYSEAFIKETTGAYIYNPDELIEVYYKNNKLFLNWKGGEIVPVALAENEFFVPDMYKKFRFVQHPETKERYLSVISEEDEIKITYDYLKAPDGYKTPSNYLKEGDYEKALLGYLKIKQQDSTSTYIEEGYFNRLGYQHIRNKEYEKAIGVFSINTILYPNSANVYDSLAEAFLRNGDSLQAFNNYKKAYNMYPGNKRAEKYIKAFSTSEKL
jgi:tetratricopeptide (TPR) repeat protein